MYQPSYGPGSIYPQPPNTQQGSVAIDPDHVVIATSPADRYLVHPTSPPLYQAPPPPYPQPQQYTQVVVVGPNYPQYPQAMVVAERPLDAQEAGQLDYCRTCALGLSITSLLCTCCLWFSIPAIVLAARERSREAAPGYRISIILSSIAIGLTIIWVIVVAVCVPVLVIKAVSPRVTINAQGFSAGLGN